MSKSFLTYICFHIFFVLSACAHSADIPNSNRPLSVDWHFYGRLDNAWDFEKIFTPSLDNYVLFVTRSGHHYTTAELAIILRNLAIWVKKKWPESERIHIGDISLLGGSFSPHQSHQTGLDVDIAYLKNNRAEQTVRGKWFTESFVIEGAVSKNFDVRRNFELLAHLVSKEPKSAIFIDRRIKKALEKYGRKINSEIKFLDHLHPYPGHKDHFHIIIQCPTSHPTCKLDCSYIKCTESEESRSV